MPEQNLTQVSVLENVYTISVQNADAITVNIEGDQTDLVVNNFALPAGQSASQINFQSYGQIAGPTVYDAVRQLTDLAMYRQAGTPAASGGGTIDEGNLWYNTTTNELKAYRETSNGVFEWVPIIVGSAGGTSDLLDAGAF
tara:strand:+ start:1296 stop:1718 length:423 start_codon:yes stop_codon:yes gene_type:complete